MQLLRESNSGVIVGELTSSLGVLRRKREAVVDVQDAIVAARRPDDGCGLDFVGLGVDVA